MSERISVIVPVYKVEPYLRRCVDSILAQTYTNLEVILVDDGSPDDCPAICDEYARIDSRVKVIHKENGGLSDARNAGMAMMNGEYLMFVDSDDCLTADAVEVLLTHAQQSGVPVLGLVENMAWFTPAELPNNRYYIFGKDGGKQLAEELKIPLLGQVPLII